MQKLIACILFIGVFLVEPVHNAEGDKALFYQINEYRKTNGLAPLVWDEKLHDACRHHSRYLSITKECEHEEEKKVEGIKRMKQPEDRVEKYVTKDYRWVKENVAYDMANDEIPFTFIRSWKESPPHNKAMLSNDNRTIYAAVCCLELDGECWSTMLLYTK